MVKVIPALLILTGLALPLIEPAVAAPAKAAPVKAVAAPATPAKGAAAKPAPGQTKKEASFSDPPVGAKSQEELLKKFAAAYKNKDGGAYISLLKVPYRERVQMEIQFQRECLSPVGNFKLVSVEGESFRCKAPNANLGKPRTVNGVPEDYDLPVVSFIDYEVRPNVQRPPDVIGMAVGEDKASQTYYIVIRHPLNNKKAAAPAAAGAKAH
ncbi:MAG: hypothetical protein JSS86_13070 [Cyanobacteria bacterium SZAS LIN-2]|nr:hypothetical protein [Cyanobacteria bacterium SZAS LIN-2]MBS2007470.1 hypothetical protein [Cyanobacteria bacterium SZAS TMP-1]